MKIYRVQYIAIDDNTYTEFFTNKALAQKRYNKLYKNEDKIMDDFRIDKNNAMCKMCFDISEFKCDISAKGILNMLNTHFSEQQ